MLTITALGLYSIVSGLIGTPEQATVPSNDIAIIQNIEVSPQKREEKETVDIEKFVREYFAETPILAEIAKCESHFRQTDSNGDVMRGKRNRYDVGVMQINELYHLDTAIKLDIDIHTLEGNLAYAKYLYEKQGARPWLASSACWSKGKELAIR